MVLRNTGHVDALWEARMFPPESRMRGLTFLLAAAALAVLAVLALRYDTNSQYSSIRSTWRIFGWICNAKWYELPDTEYAEDYSHAGFAQIEIGMSGQEVLDILGQPLTRWQPYGRKKTRFKDKAHFVGLQYSHSPTSTHYMLRQIYLDRGVVAEKIGYYYGD